MDLRSGYPFWLVQDGLLGAYPPLTEAAHCDVVVIGAGITGALVGYYLASAGVNCIVLDRREVGWGSTSASTALLLYELDTPLVDLIDEVGTTDAVRCYRLGVEAITAIEWLAREVQTDKVSPRFIERHSLYIASSAADAATLARECEERRHQGFRGVALLDERDLKQRASFSAPAALLSEGAAEVDPLALTHGLLQRGMELGLRVFDRTAVMGIDGAPGQMQVTTNRGHTVTCDRVVMATGYETLDQVRGQSGTLVSTYACVTEPLASFDGWPDECIIWESARPYVYLRQCGDGRAMIGGFDERITSAEKRDALIGAKTRELMDRFRAMFPRISAEPAFAWSGFFVETADGLPLIGESATLPGLVFALAYGANGITFGVVAAGIIRDLCLGRPNDDLRLFRCDRPSLIRIPPIHTPRRVPKRT